MKTNIKEQTTEQLETSSRELAARYEALRKEPATRHSAAGGMIQEARVITEMETVDSELGPVNAEIERRKNPSDIGQTYFIRYGRNHVIPCVVRHGLVESGGLLPNYFVGRRASEHESYVRGRHGKRLTLVSFDNLKFNDAGYISFRAKLDKTEFDFESKFVITRNEKEYFYIKFENKTIKPVDGTRGASEHQRDLLTYGAAYFYQKLVATGKNINIQ